MNRIKAQTIALALTWDGARWPLGKLSPKARAFLARENAKPATSGAVSRLLAEDQVREIRICWVPSMKGGDETLNNPFTAPSNRRTKYRLVRSVQMGDVLGAVYRK